MNLGLRCREGDLALIIREEAGCEANIGRVVRVGGPLELNPLWGPTWLIEPVNAEPWMHVAHSRDDVVTRPITFADRIEHSDDWLLPLHPDGDDLADLAMRWFLGDAMLERPERVSVEEAADQTAT